MLKVETLQNCHTTNNYLWQRSMDTDSNKTKSTEDMGFMRKIFLGKLVSGILERRTYLLLREIFNEPNIVAVKK